MFAFARIAALAGALLAAACHAAVEGGSLSAPDSGPAVEAGPPDAGAPDARAPDAGRRDATPVDTGTIDAGPSGELRDRLLSIEGLDVEEVDAPIAGTRAFLLKLRQPEDHGAPAGTSFKQRLVLVHRADNAPMVLATTGYGLFGDPLLWTDRLSEPAAALDANQLVVEHRFFGESIARTPNWTHLDIEQSANDSHRIVELFSAIYGGPWIGTGVSKGGMTAIFHHRFFPDDLAAIVPYVAPISFGPEDTRYIPWLAQIGPADGLCRTRVLDMAVELIERRAELAQYVIATDPAAAAFRTEVIEAVLTYPAFGWHWSFWQYYGSLDGCAVLPVRGDAVEVLAGWFPFNAEYVLGSPFDPDIGPYRYQVRNELGLQAIDSSHLAAVASQVDYSVVPQVSPDPDPWPFDPRFDPRPMFDVDTFLRTRARHVLGVYGAWDPWTGGIITVDEANDSTVVIVPEIGHAAQLALLPEPQQDEALARLNTWIGRRTLQAPDWSEARARMRARSADHQWWVHHTQAAGRSLR